MRRTIVYIDGFNLYHAVDALDDPALKWLDLWALAETILRSGEILCAVKYFTAFAAWRPNSFAKHRDYVAAQQARGVEVILGQFKEKRRRCVNCRARVISHEEKETDVQIAVHMVADALSDAVDRAILISADTDLTPPIKMIAALVPQCEVFVAAPPGRLGICRALGPKLELTPGRIRKCLLPQVVQIGATRTVTCPLEWR